jgi:hypothetical protein
MMEVCSGEVKPQTPEDHKLIEEAPKAAGRRRQQPGYQEALARSVAKYNAWKAESDARDEECRAICRRQLEEHLATLTPRQREDYGKSDADLVEESRALMGIKSVEKHHWLTSRGLSDFIEDDEDE